MSSAWIRIILLIFYGYLINCETMFEDGGKVPVTAFEHKSYYFSYNLKLNFFYSDYFCKGIGMNLVTIPSQEVNDFLYKKLNSLTQNNFQYWTSGSKLIDRKEWIWFSSAEKITYTNWIGGKPTTTSDADCIMLKLEKNKDLKWYNENCVEILSFICESPDVYGIETLPPADWKGVFADPTKSPTFPVYNFEGHSYFVRSLSPLTYFEATLFCNILDMQLASIESKEENVFINKILRDTCASGHYWISGTTMIKNNWHWFPSGDKLAISPWNSGQGLTNKYAATCIHLYVDIEKPLYWGHENCFRKLNFICETSMNYIDFCSRGDDLEIPENDILPFIYYHVIKKKETHVGATKKCEELNLKLLSIENEAKNIHVNNVIQLMGIINYPFWTSGYLDEVVWRWWSGDVITTFFWKVKPTYGINACLAIRSEGEGEDKSVNYWFSPSCNNKYYYICEPL